VVITPTVGREIALLSGTVGQTASVWQTAAASDEQSP
jgi:hypothetical protein